jgi:hypothetical protein
MTRAATAASASAPRNNNNNNNLDVLAKLVGKIGLARGACNDDCGPMPTKPNSTNLSANARIEANKRYLKRMDERKECMKSCTNSHKQLKYRGGSRKGRKGTRKGRKGSRRN